MGPREDVTRTEQKPDPLQNHRQIADGRHRNMALEAPSCPVPKCRTRFKAAWMYPKSFSLSVGYPQPPNPLRLIVFPLEKAASLTIRLSVLLRANPDGSTRKCSQLCRD